jgi:hypothetical protein
MFRPASALVIAALAAAPAFATTYSASPSGQVAPKIVAKQLVWTCGAGTCSGATSESRPVIVCQSLAKKAGRIESFTADGRAFSAAELDRCNSAAKDGGTTAVASARN